MSSTRPFLRSQNSPNSASGPAAAPPATQAAIAAAHEREEGNRASFCGPSEASFRSALCRNLLEAAPRRCLTQQFMRRMYTSASYRSKGSALVQQEVLSVEALCQLSGYLLGNVLPSLIFPVCSSDTSASCPFLKPGASSNSGHPGSKPCECTLLLKEQPHGFPFIADRLRTQRQGLLLRTRQQQQQQKQPPQQQLTPAIEWAQIARSIRFMLFAEVFWGGRLYHNAKAAHCFGRCHCCSKCRLCGQPAEQQQQWQGASHHLRTFDHSSTDSSSSNISSGSSTSANTSSMNNGVQAEDLQTARRAAAFAPSLNRLLIRAAFSALLQQLQRATSAVKLATQRQRKRSVEGGGGGQIHFSLVLQHLQTDAGTLDQLLAALLLYDALLSPLQQQQQQIFLLQRLLLLVGREGWQQLRLCRLSARLIFEAAAGNILRVLRIAKTLPFLLQAAAYRHIDALRAAAIAACIAAAPVGGASLPLSRLAALLGCSSSSALQFCHQLPQPHQTGPQKYLQTPITAVRLFRGGQMQFVSASSEAAAKADVTQPQVLDLHKFAGAAYSDAWLRLQPAEETVRAAPRNRKQLRELMLQDTLGQQHLPIGFGSA
ncbi:uncharacterized protein LOC34618848 [Cyclospora cayetanensis]|uniref:Uncharacterized protein LOC34618848 n=1 Tax=Cyclospora cayetanensis TaxID=88456 RepID=A0A6P6RZW1_9EIME|nr:uncharacterized protein LOC34618848 [Cyclospora cayetanensis]